MSAIGFSAEGNWIELCLAKSQEMELNLSLWPP